MTNNKGQIYKFIHVIFVEPLNLSSYIWLTIIMGLSLIMEMMAYLQIRFFTWLTPRIWLASAIVISFAILIPAIILLLSDLREKYFLPVIVIAIVAGLLLWPFFDPSRSVIGQDATQQMAAGLKAFTQFDWNYTGKAFLDYPSRQYLLAALPSLLLGRTELALKIGFTWPFWLGLLLFADSLRQWVKEKGVRWGDGLALAAVTALFVFPYVTEYYLYFEQAIYPCCFTLQVIGWLLYFLRKPTLFHALALTWTGCMLIYCYTTAIAVILLLVFLLGAYGFLSAIPAKRHKNINFERKINLTGNPLLGWTSLLMAATIFMTFVFSLLFGRSDRITVLGSSQVSELLQAVLKGLTIAFTNNPAIFASFLLPFVWLYLVAALSLRLGKLNLVIAVWTLGVIVLSQVLQGYAVYPAPISFSRTIVTVPVLVTAWFLLLTDWLSKQKEEQENMLHYLNWIKDRNINIEKVASLLLSALIAFNIAAGLDNLRRPIVQGDAAKYIAPAYLHPMQLVISDLNQRLAIEKISANDEFTFVLYTDDVWLKNPEDYTCYFFPKARVIVLESGCVLPADIDRQKPLIIYLIEGTPADEVLIYKNKIETVSLEFDENRSVYLQRLVLNFKMSEN